MFQFLFAICLFEEILFITKPWFARKHWCRTCSKGIWQQVSILKRRLVPYRTIFSSLKSEDQSYKNSVLKVTKVVLLFLDCGLDQIMLSYCILYCYYLNRDLFLRQIHFKDKTPFIGLAPIGQFFSKHPSVINQFLFWRRTTWQNIF